MDRNPKIVVLITLAITVLIILIFASLFLLINSRSGTNNNQDVSITKNLPEIELNGKQVKNPTFQDIGFFRNSGTTREQLAKVISVNQTESRVTATLQLNTNTDLKQEILFYDNKLAPLNLVQTIHDGYIFSNGQIDVKVLKGKKEIYDTLFKNKNKNIYLRIYTEDPNQPQLADIYSCNKKLINKINLVSTKDLNCTPSVIDFFINEK